MLSFFRCIFEVFRHISGDNFQFVIFTVASEGLKYGLDNVENCREHNLLFNSKLQNQ